VTTVAAPVLIKVVNAWCNHDKHDKVYRVELLSFNSKYSVVGQFGRRGKATNVFVIMNETAFAYMAYDAFETKVHDLTKKGYKAVNEDVSKTAELTEK
jgi:hypothetical protein